MLQMVDLHSQHQKIRSEVDAAVKNVIDSGRFIGGSEVESFADELAKYLGVKHVIPCANGTDALQIALMALGLRRGDEVIVPAFTYVASAEVIGLLGLKPILIDVQPDTFNIDTDLIEELITPKTKAIIPVHLFGQSADMENLMEVAQKHNLFVVEDNAQAIGADYTFKNMAVKTGTIGHIGCTSFFPSKNLGCVGDGGAMMTNDDKIAATLRTIANHGQSRQYYHDVLGVNSRLDAIQAAILRIKLRNLDTYNKARNWAADEYDKYFSGQQYIVTPVRSNKSSHVFHQYTLRITNGQRNGLKAFLDSEKIPSMIYYPVPLHQQGAYKKYSKKRKFPVTELLCDEVISLPMHSEHSQETLAIIANTVLRYFNKF